MSPVPTGSMEYSYRKNKRDQKLIENTVDGNTYHILYTKVIPRVAENKKL
jgi:hypothetical protein